HRDTRSIRRNIRRGLVGGAPASAHAPDAGRSQARRPDSRLRARAAKGPALDRRDETCRPADILTALNAVKGRSTGHGAESRHATSQHGKRAEKRHKADRSLTPPEP